jgi:hypothetical protein
LATQSKAVVVPVLVAHDENFQIRIIGNGIAKVNQSKDKVIYKPDAILPDENLKKWVIKIASDYAHKIKEERK